MAHILDGCGYGAAEAAPFQGARVEAMM